MRLFYSFLVGCLATGLVSGQSLPTQSFETTGGNWSFTISPSSYNVSGDVWDTVSSLGTITGPNDGTLFWGMQDLDNSNGGGAFAHTLDMAPTSLTGLSNAKLKFDYYTDGWDGSYGDTLGYIVEFDNGTSWGTMTSLNLNTDAWVTESINIPSTSSWVRIRFYARQNGGTDYGGFDNVRIDTSTAAPPPPPAVPLYSIAQVSGEDSDGVADSTGVTCAIRGTVYTIDFDGNSGYSFYVHDGTDGMNIFNFNDVDNYVVTLGDSLYLEGSITQYNGLTELDVDSISVISQNNPVGTPMVVSSLNAGTERKFIRINNVTLVNPSQWPTTSGSANVDITNGTDTMIMRIDSDTDIDGTPAPTGSFDVVGAGSQFDNSSPYTSGYQIFPRSLNDIVTGTLPNPSIPLYSISQIEGEDASGVADSSGVVCALRATVYTIDFDGNSGYSFYVQDGTGGMNIFNFNDVDNYVVNIGDSLHLEGSITQYNGLTELDVDSIYLISQGNTVHGPSVVTSLNAGTERKFIRINNVTLVNPSQWPTSSGSANVDITNGTDTMIMRIDSDTDIDGTPAPTGSFDVVGAGSQFDNSSPYTSGYQIFPRSLNDIVTGTLPNPSIPLYSISQIEGEDASGVADSSGVVCALRATVYTIDFDGNSGYSFYVQDGTGGINIFNFNDVDNYVVNIGDSLHLEGSITQYNGLTELDVDSIYLISQGNTVHGPSVVTSLNAGTERKFIRINNVTLVNPSQWPTSSGSANVDITNGTDTMIMRIDSDTDIDGTPAPTGSFDVVGAGSQFDNSSPYTSGYQIFPRSLNDIITSGSSTPAYMISDITGVDANGVADSLNVYCAITGMVSGDNLRGSGVEFWMIEPSNNDGLLVRNTSYNNYTVTEGDILWMSGSVDQYNGLIQFVPDSISVTSSGNMLPSPLVTSVLNESTEGRLLEMQYMSIQSGTWPVPGASANITVTDGTNTFTMRIDGDTDIADSITSAPTGLFHLRGHGGQFDGSSSYTSGYQILPRYSTDIIPVAVTSPTISFNTGQQYVAEGAGSVPVHMLIGPVSTNAETVKVYVQEGMGITPGDYTTTPAASMDTISLTIPAGEDTVSFMVNIVDDAIIEDNDTLFFSIGAVSSGLTVGPIASQDFIIADNDILIPSYSVSDINGLDTNYLPDSLGVYCKLSGVVLGVDLQGTASNSVQFTFHDNGEGFGVYSSAMTNYTVTEGDMVRIIGTITHFNGLAQMDADSIVLISQANPIPTPTVVTVLDESTESELVRINGVSIPDPTQWTNSGSGFNVDITDGVNTWEIRIDNEVDLYAMPAPVGTFDVVGIGGQYDPSAPHNSGYQLLPRYSADIIYPQPASYDLAITEIMPGSANPNTAVNDDWFEITNYGSSTINLNGFSFDDDSEIPGTQVFGNVSIAGGESIIVWRGDQANEGDFKTTWRINGANPQLISSDELTGSGSFPGFGQGGDLAVLYDTSMVPVEICLAAYPTANAGRSIEFDTSCTYLGDATAGVNGAYFSNGGYDQGSPGNVSPDVSISEFGLNTIKVFPNPANDFLVVETDLTGTFEIQMFNMLGAEVLHNGSVSSADRIDVSALMKGAYVLKISQDGKSARMNVVIQ